MAELTFDCTGAQADRYAVVPALSLTLRISETSGQRVEAIALRCQIRIEPARRRYSGTEAERLNDLFGDTERWATTLRPLQLVTVATMVPGFSGSIETELPINFTYDLEIGATRYFASLDDGEVPLLLLFSGTVFSVVDGRIQVQQVPWSKETSYRLPVSVWREAIDAHFPNSAWIKMSNQTMAELHRFKTAQALPTWDLTIQALLSSAERGGGENRAAADASQAGNGRCGMNVGAPQAPGRTPQSLDGLAAPRRRDSASPGDDPRTPVPPEAREAPRADRPRGRPEGTEQP